MFAGRASAIGIGAVAILGTMTVGAGAEPRAVIELFTSQGCSSCPPADKLLGELGKDPTLIAVSLPVHYWDYLGWKDTLAHPRHSARQKAYSQSRGDGDVYTPQVVVNGRAQALGSDRVAIARAVDDGRVRNPALPVPVRLTVAEGNVLVSAGEAESGLSGEVWLWGLATSIAVAIRRGENVGRTVTYSNVVRRWLKLGEWPGEVRRWTIPLAEIKAEAVDAVVAIVQGGSAENPGAILGAGMTRLIVDPPVAARPTAR